MLWQDDESKLLDPNKLKEDELGLPGVPALAPSSSNIVGAGAGAIGGPAAAGGSSNGWTNIQSYIAANNKDTGSSQRLQSSVQPAFAAEKTGIDTDADKFKSAEKNTFDSLNIDPNQMSDIVNQQKEKAWKPLWNTASDEARRKADYDQNARWVNKHLTSDWQPNTQWDHTISEGTQRIGTTLQNDGAFKRYLESLDEKVVGRPLTTGQHALQAQFNTSNPDLRETRSKLLKDYAGLGEHIGNRQKEVADYTKGLGTTFRTNQTTNRDYVNNMGTKAEQDQALAEANARAAYQNDFGELLRLYDSLQNFGGRPYGAAPVDVQGQSSPFNRWYGAQDLKHRNTGDDQKRDWNIVADFLGLAEPRKTRGTFSVRG